jgi:hypothetical protein
LLNLPVQIDQRFPNSPMILKILIALKIQQILMFRCYLMYQMCPCYLKILMYLCYPNFMQFRNYLKIPMIHHGPMILSSLMNQLILKILKYQLNRMYQIVQTIQNYLKNLQIQKIQLLCSKRLHRIYKFVWLQMNKLMNLPVHY